MIECNYFECDLVTHRVLQVPSKFSLRTDVFVGISEVGRPVT